MFEASLRRGNVARDDYDAVDDEERKPLDDGERDRDFTEREIYALSRSLRRTNLFLKVIIGLLCIVIVALLSINVPDTVQKIRTYVAQRLIKSPVPIIPNQIIMFEKNPIYSQPPNDASDQAWDKLLPDGRGFVYVPDWKKYDLPPGQTTDWGMIYSVALFHQMHCLGQLRRFSWMFLNAILKNDTSSQDEIKHLFTHMSHQEHLNHCFDYLRQTIQCAGDMTMEWPKTEPDGKRFQVDGWGIPHECKNWGIIEEYMDKNHFNMSWNNKIAPIDIFDQQHGNQLNDLGLLENPQEEKHVEGSPQSL